jgi:hypothetical protein
MTTPKFNLYDRVINPNKPQIVCIIAQVKIVDRDTANERAVYTMTYDKKNGERGLMHNIEEHRIQLHQPELF